MSYQSPFEYLSLPSPSLTPILDEEEDKENTIPFQEPAAAVKELESFMDLASSGSEASNGRAPLREIYRQFKPEDMLGPGEKMEGEPVRVPLIARLTKCLYMSIEGTRSGVFTSFATAHDQVKELGVPCLAFPAFEEAHAAWAQACLGGKVVNEVHKDSVCPMIVSKEVLEQRAEIATLRSLMCANAARKAVEEARALVDRAADAAKGATGRVYDSHAQRPPAAFGTDVLMGSGLDGPSSAFSAPPSPPASPGPVLPAAHTQAAAHAPAAAHSPATGHAWAATHIPAPAPAPTVAAHGPAVVQTQDLAAAPTAGNIQLVSLAEGLPDQAKSGFIMVWGNRPGICLRL